ncbi:DUF86 domain-containing protein [Aeribacillus alveayuensis]|uniref:Uncharacterized protein YutE (UPF0331/DUF86 family) n=1 Tax=Aeribacillus alveayuensis TaxID=279215 RepID=A0ABT9VM85_9BACI|nr:uncharacterized protein YutE (UPF0331/DUF86 family) [Bacillus alveayuensis]
MYFVDREKIEQMLKYLEDTLAIFEKQKGWTSDVEKKALERMVQMVIEAILDVGNAMIDGFIMRDPGSFEDIIDILQDEQVIAEHDAIALKEVIMHRKQLVQHYLQINHDELLHTVKKQMAALKRFPEQIRFYLENELGPVSAFRK